MTYKIEDIRNKIICGETLEELKKFPSESINLIVTSPPYFSLRDYGEEGQIGLEPTIDEYLNKLLAITHELKRVLRPDGVMMWNHGDSYASKGTLASRFYHGENQGKHKLSDGNFAGRCRTSEVPAKCLVMQNYRLILRMLDEQGWILREQKIWAKKIHIVKENKTIGSCMPSCLSQNTEIYIKNKNGIISKIVLGELLNLDIKKYQILSPTGWKKIKNIWKVKKDKIMEFKFGSSGNVVCSLKHKFPISHDNRRKNYDIKQAKDFRDSKQKMLDRLLFVPIGKFLDNQTKIIKTIDILPKLNFYVNEGEEIKNKINKSFTEIARDLGIKIKLYKYGIWAGQKGRSKGRYGSKLSYNYASQKVLPLKVLQYYKINGIYNISHKHHPKSNIPSEIILDYNLGRFIGLYAAEGGFTKNEKSGAGKFTFHRKEKEFINFVSKYLNDIFKTKTVTIKTIKNFTTVTFSSVPLKYFLKYFCPGVCKEKKLNINYILNCPYEFRKGIFNGIIEGDGHITKDNRITYASASKQLRDDVLLLASSINLLSSKYDSIPYDKRTQKFYYSYLLNIPISLQREIDKGERIKKGSNSIYKNVFNSKTLKISQMKIINRNEELIDIEVEDELFLINGGLVSHNSANDRSSPCFEPVFMLVKSQKYWYDQDAVRIPITQEFDMPEQNNGEFNIPKYAKNSEFEKKYGEPWDRFGKNTNKFRKGRGGNNEELGNRNFMPIKKQNWREEAEKRGQFFENPILHQGGGNTGLKKAQTKIPREQAENFGSPRARNYRKPLEERMQDTKSEKGSLAFNMKKTLSEVRTEEKPSFSLGANPPNVMQINPQPLTDIEHFACVDEKTEILTIEGWKNYQDIKKYQYGKRIVYKSIRVATYNLEKKIIEYQPTTNLKEYDYNGKLIKVGNRDLDILMTPNHRNVVIKSNKKEKIVLAENLAYMDKIKVLAPVEYKVEYFVGIKWAELIGWIIAEGHYSKEKHILIYQNAGKNEKRIDYLLQEIPHTKKLRKREYKKEIKNQITWYIKKCAFADWVFQFIPKKELNRLLVSLPKKELQALFNGLIAGDGHTRKDDGRIVFIQKNKNCVDWFEILAMRLDYHSLTTKKREGNCYMVFLTKKTEIGTRGTNSEGTSIKKVQYKGKIWCPTTFNGTWIAKRNGKIFITGNSFPEALVRPLILNSCPKEICPKCGKARERIKDTKRPKLNSSTPYQGNEEWIHHGEGKSTLRTTQYIERETLGWTKCKCGEKFKPGIVLDPFGGVMTTGVVSKKFGRDFIGIDLSQTYCKLGQERIRKTSVPLPFKS